MRGAVVNIADARKRRRGPCVDVRRRGFNVVYRLNEPGVLHCPGCGRQHWYIGRTMAECAFCATAVPIEQPGSFLEIQRP